MKQIDLIRSSKKSLHQQIYTALRTQILRGDIAAGEPLPSYRFMSRKYAITVSTVEKAYELLEMNGYIERRHGSGCYVLPLDSFEFFADSVVLDSFEEGQSKPGDLCDLATSTPLAGPDETAAFVQIIQRLAQERPEVLFRYPPTRGVPSLIHAVWRRLTQAGIETGPERIHIVGGSQQGVDLICRSLVSKSSVVLTEDPSYSVAVNCFRRAGAQLRTVPMLEDGPDMDAVREVLASTPIDLYYTMPRSHCPTNVTWRIEKQRDLLALADRYGFTVIEDDCLGALAPSDGTTQPFRRLDASGSVIYLDSFSKSLVPGMRLGYMVVPARYGKRFLMAKFNADIASPAILQETLAVYLESGAYDRHLARLRETYAQKRRLMAQAIRSSRYLTLPYGEQDGGVFFWVRLPDGIDSMELWERLRDHGVKVLPSAVFSHTGAWKEHIRISYVGCPQEQIGDGIERIDREIEAMRLDRLRH